MSTNRKTLTLLGASLLLLIGMLPVQAETDELLTVSMQRPFADVLDKAGSMLEKHGFTVAHVQQCDGGLHKMGYAAPDYKVIFFGRLAEVRELSKHYPQLIPLFPFKLAVYTENERSVVSVLNPASLAGMLAADQTLTEHLQQWEREFNALLADLASEQLAAK